MIPAEKLARWLDVLERAREDQCDVPEPFRLETRGLYDTIGEVREEYLRAIAREAEVA